MGAGARDDPALRAALREEAFANTWQARADEILDAHAHPERHPDLIVRVTGFSAYFTSLSPAFRQLVVKRLIREAV